MSDTDYLAAEDAWPKKGSSGNSSTYGYTVEARMAYHTPEVVCGQAFDLRWKPVQFDQAVVGVPSPRYPREPGEHGLYGLAQAEALRWWFVAAAESERPAYCLETRIVKHKISTSFSIEAVSAQSRHPKPKDLPTPPQDREATKP